MTSRVQHSFRRKSGKIGVKQIQVRRCRVAGVRVPATDHVHGQRQELDPLSCTGGLVLPHLVPVTASPPSGATRSTTADWRTLTVRPVRQETNQLGAGDGSV